MKTKEVSLKKKILWVFLDLSKKKWTVNEIMEKTGYKNRQDVLAECDKLANTEVWTDILEDKSKKKVKNFKIQAGGNNLLIRDIPKLETKRYGNLRPTRVYRLNLDNFCEYIIGGLILEPGTDEIYCTIDKETIEWVKQIIISKEFQESIKKYKNHKLKYNFFNRLFDPVILSQRDVKKILKGAISKIESLKKTNLLMYNEQFENEKFMREAFFKK